MNKVFKEATAREPIPQWSSSWGKTLHEEWYSSLSNTDEMTVIRLRESGMTSQPVKSMYKLRMKDKNGVLLSYLGLSCPDLTLQPQWSPKASRALYLANYSPPSNLSPTGWMGQASRYSVATSTEGIRTNYILWSRQVKPLRPYTLSPFFIGEK